ncbi:hypothetical protein [Halopseudomonas pelagia]|uniref:hypothetical protein n=1 Tax=Halopseudomonas pelagia TaxID=553151 RepID=UPI0003A72D3D|nr:hypothetical protein [Halopseudomonas pelagia]|tara:strand:- start:227 stop:1150 length:924 start_codon:yes stop_codon:yes gene_type:complete
MSHEQIDHIGIQAMKILRLLLIGCGLLLSSLSNADTLLVIIPGPSSLTAEFIDHLRAQRSEDEVLVHNLANNDPAPNASLLVVMGSTSMQWRLEQNIDTPTIGIYISRSSLADQKWLPLPDHIQIILANPAPSRQLKLASLLTPRLSAIGALYSPAHQAQLAEWQQASSAIGVDFFSLPLENQQQLSRQLTELLENSDVLVAIDDPSIYNANNLKAILLSSYTRNKVLIGPSAPFINAGSLSTTYSTPSQMAQSVDDTLTRPWQPGAIDYPRYFSVLSNAQVARSLGFPPPNDEDLADKLRQQEERQ